MVTKYAAMKTQVNSGVSSPKFIPGNLKANGTSLRSARISQNQITILQNNGNRASGLGTSPSRANPILAPVDHSIHIPHVPLDKLNNSTVHLPSISS